MRLVFVLGFMVVSSTAFSQEYSTDIPPAITIPDHVDTRLGTLKFKDGFPDDATVEKVYDNLDFQRGVQAFLIAMPAASQAAMTKGPRSFGPDNQTVLVFETLMDSRSLYLTANTESIYAFARLNLRNGPVVVEVRNKVAPARGGIAGACLGRRRASAGSLCVSNAPLYEMGNVG